MQNLCGGQYFTLIFKLLWLFIINALSVNLQRQTKGKNILVWQHRLRMIRSKEAYALVIELEAMSKQEFNDLIAHCTTLINMNLAQDSRNIKLCNKHQISPFFSSNLLGNFGFFYIENVNCLLVKHNSILLTTVKEQVKSKRYNMITNKRSFLTDMDFKIMRDTFWGGMITVRSSKFTRFFQYPKSSTRKVPQETSKCNSYLGKINCSHCCSHNQNEDIDTTRNHSLAHLESSDLIKKASDKRQCNPSLEYLYSNQFEENRLEENLLKIQMDLLNLIDSN